MDTLKRLEGFGLTEPAAIQAVMVATRSDGAGKFETLARKPANLPEPG